MVKVLTPKWLSKSAPKAAKGLLGKYLVRRQKGRLIAYKITETEAYEGPKDRASHAFGGRRTKRTEIMFGEAGYWYVYFTYGMHWMLNIVVGKKGYPAAVLIRAVEGTDGPARLTKRLKIDKKLNGKLASRKSGLWIENRGEKVPIKNIKKAPRVGVDYAGSYWSKKKWRFRNDKK
jgi:DNA-3-methyladenine glycosylase